MVYSPLLQPSFSAVGIRMRDHTARRRTRRDERKEATHQQVLEAARRVFLAEGYEGATIKAIAGEAGVSAGTVLNVAPTKGALLVMILREEYDAIRDSVDRLEAALSGNLIDRLGALVQVIMEAQVRHEELFAAAIAHSWMWTDEVYEETAGHMSEAWGAVSRLIRAGMDSGELRSDIDPREAALMLEDVYLGVTRRTRGARLDLASTSAMMHRRLRMAVEGLASR